MSGKILNYGSFNIDQTFTVPHIVKTGETLSATDFNARPGGKGNKRIDQLFRCLSGFFHTIKK